jgi:hypothetical protein
VGVGTTIPKAPFNVTTNKTVLFGDDTTTSSGTNKLVWFAGKAALRAGVLSSTDTIGNYSTGIGFQTKANGDYSFAAGHVTTASGYNSTAMGSYTTASFLYSTAMGYNTTASASYSTAMGYNTTASGLYSTAMGYNTTASSDNSTAMGSGTTANHVFSTAMGEQTIASEYASTAMGTQTTASGYASTAMGSQTIASGDGSTAMGWLSLAKAYVSTAIGFRNDFIASSNPTVWVNTDPLFYIGNGYSTFHNATVIYKNGDADLNGYVRLGEITDGSPRIKVKKITGTTPAAQGGFNFYVHGLIQSKILSITGLATIPGGFQIIPNQAQAGYQYTINVDNGNIAVGTVAGNSSGILNAPIVILITYEE